MYIHAIIKNREGKLHQISVKNDSKADPPTSFVDHLKYSFATNSLLFKFAKEIRKYANPNHAIIEVHTDNAILALKLLNQGLNVIYQPQELEEALNEA